MLMVFYFAYDAFLNAAPTCFDGARNGDEHGVDCGGSCQLICREEARPPVVLWSRSFPVDAHTYTAAAYVQNPNVGAQARAVPYIFQLFDEKNVLVAERTGVLDIPPVQLVPFIDPNIDVGNRTPVRSLFALTEEPIWQRAAPLPPLRVGNQFLAADGTRVSATVYNDSNDDARQVAAVAVLFSADGVARAASRSVIGDIDHKTAKDVVFSWPDGVKGVTRAEITILPSF